MVMATYVGEIVCYVVLALGGALSGLIGPVLGPVCSQFVGQHAGDEPISDAGSVAQHGHLSRWGSYHSHDWAGCCNDAL